MQLCCSGSKKGNNRGIFISDPKYLQKILSLTNIEIIRFVEQKQLMRGTLIIIV